MHAAAAGAKLISAARCLRTQPLDKFSYSIFEMMPRLISKHATSCADVGEAVPYIARTIFPGDLGLQLRPQRSRQHARNVVDADRLAGSDVEGHAVLVAAGDPGVVPGLVRHHAGDLALEVEPRGPAQAEDGLPVTSTVGFLRKR